MNASILLPGPLVASAKAEALQTNAIRSARGSPRALRWAGAWTQGSVSVGVIQEDEIVWSVRRARLTWIVSSRATGRRHAHRMGAVHMMRAASAIQDLWGRHVICANLRWWESIARPHAVGILPAAPTGDALAGRIRHVSARTGGVAKTVTNVRKANTERCAKSSVTGRPALESQLAMVTGHASVNRDLPVRCAPSALKASMVRTVITYATRRIHATREAAALRQMASACAKLDGWASSARCMPTAILT